MADERAGVLVRILEHAARTRSLFLRPDRPVPFVPGQFLSFHLPVGDTPLTRPYTIASRPETTDELELLVDHVAGGPGSGHLFTRRPGDVLRFTGPWGTFVLDRQPDADTVFVAEGSAIAPIRPMAHRACATGRHPIRLLYGLGDDAPRVYADEFDALAAAHPRFTWHAVPSAALETEVRRRFVDADADRSRHFFLCGVGERVRRLRRLLRDAGYARRGVLWERW